MKIEGVQEFADLVGRAGKSLESFGKRTQSAGKAIMRAGLVMMVAGALLLLLVWLVFA